MNADEKLISSRVSRRGFIGTTASATLAALIGGEPQLVLAAGPKATADAVIVLWMAGGMAQTETFDPKRYTPFEPGVRTEKVLSTFPSIDTAVDNIKFSQGLERIGASLTAAPESARFRARISASFCIRGINTIGTRVTCPRKRSQCRTWAP